MLSRIKLQLIFTFLLISYCSLIVFSQVKPASFQTEKYLRILHGKKIGVVANASSVVGQTNIVDTLLRSGIDVKVVFSPEHGFKLKDDAGQQSTDYTDPDTGLRIISLYGLKKKPAEMDLSGIDMVVFDIQDVGARFYTYISTLSLVMEACAENKIGVLVLDRPNPNAFYIDGPVLDPKYKSFVGMHPVPVVYGMTIGEYAKMVNGEGWLKDGVSCELSVLPVENYTHQTAWFPQTRPSPNLPDANSILLYPSLCFFEGTVISVGRGTSAPFEVYGHPGLQGYSFNFTPVVIKGMDSRPMYKDKTCYGENLQKYYELHPADKGRITLSWLIRAFQNLGSKPDFFNPYFDQLAGTSKLQEQIVKGMKEEDIRSSWKAGIEAFKKIREKYLLYP
ncbi:MAG: DUF1343 domain-containing protein [Bacteroidetes bacterium]|nr:DUF1343 domain-containing protein [Bacteroidota bacterium]